MQAISTLEQHIPAQKDQLYPMQTYSKRSTSPKQDKDNLIR